MPVFQPLTLPCDALSEYQLVRRLLEWCNDALVQVQMETLAEPHIGFAMLPKRTVNVKTCELLRFARITPDFVHAVSVGATRARLDLFQDDLYPPCVTGQPCISMQEYASGSDVPELPRRSLQPEGMQARSCLCVCVELCGA
jgi:hypothetical protein